MPGNHDIVLVHMPFGSLEWPSASLGLLSAAVQRAGINVATTYPVLRFAEEVGYELYAFVSRSLPSELLLHDWIFSAHVMPADREHSSAYIADLNRFVRNSRAKNLPVLVKATPTNHPMARFFDQDGNLQSEPLLALQAQAAAFVTRTAKAILAARPRIVGCTTTFLQYNASVSLCQELKRLDPSVITVLGGAGTEAEMGYQTMRRFPFIDLVFSGEADTLFPAVCKDLLAGDDLDTISRRYPTGLLARPFVHGRHDRRQAQQRYQPALESNLDALPLPDYRDYYAELSHSPLANTFRPPIPVEASRGCWKGAGQHCAFCGFQGERMGYRAKSANRVLSELDSLHGRHGNTVFLMADSIITMRYFNDVLPPLAAADRPYSFFYEVPPKLSEQQVRQLADAKVMWIQPGIESLDDCLLRLLDKGNKAIRNIETLKYCSEHGIRVHWNILFNIPGEDDDCYHRMEQIVPLLFHLSPPLFFPIQFSRFSPYHQRSQVYGLSLRPLDRYRTVYPFAESELAEFASIFESDQPQFPPFPQSPAKVALANAIGAWRQAMSSSATPPRLIQEMVGEDIEITDTRPCAVRSRTRLTGDAAAIYRACRQATPFADITRSLAEGPTTVSETRITEVLEALRRAALALEIGGVWLALATNPPLRPLSPDLPSYIRQTAMEHTLGARASSPASPVGADHVSSSEPGP